MNAGGFRHVHLDHEPAFFTQLLPHMDQDKIYQLYHQDHYWADAVNYTAIRTPIATLICPSSPQSGALMASRTRQ